MDIRKLQRAIVDGLEDVKGQDIVVFNTEHLSPLFERVVIASGTSNRQTKSLASGVSVAVKAAGGEVLSIEGEDNGEWIIVDCGSAVVHVMQPAIRQYYHLEEIWGGKPVKMTLSSQTRGLVKASEPVEEEDEVPAPKKAVKTAKKPATKTPAAKDSAAKPAAKKAPKAAPKVTANTESPEVAASRAAERKPAAKKTPARKTVVKSTAKGIAVPAPLAAKKAPARKAATTTAADKAVKTIVIMPTEAKKAPARKAAAGTRAAPARAPAKKAAVRKPRA